MLIENLNVWIFAFENFSCSVKKWMEGTLSKDFIEEMLSSTYDISSSTCLLSARRQVIQWTHNFQFSIFVCCTGSLLCWFVAEFVVYFDHVMLRMFPRCFIHFNTLFFFYKQHSKFPTRLWFRIFNSRCLWLLLSFQKSSLLLLIFQENNGFSKKK